MPAAVSARISTNSCGESNTRCGYAAASTPLRTAFSSSILAVRPIRQKKLKVMRQWMKGKRPTAVMVEAGRDLSISAFSGNAMGSIENFIALLGNKLIPVFRAQSTDIAEALAVKLKEINFPDAYILSSQEGILKAKAANYNFYGILDLSGDSSEITDEKLAQIRSEVNSSNAKSVLLPEAYAEKEYMAGSAKKRCQRMAGQQFS